MTAPQALEASLRSALCAPLNVSPVPVGLHVETGFMLPDGDPLDFYLVETDAGELQFEDDGTTIPNAVARGFDLRSPAREAMLTQILGDEDAHCGADLVLRSAPVDPNEIGSAGLKFISAIIRAKDLFVLHRDTVASAFADDVRAAIAKCLPEGFAAVTPPANERGGPDILVKNTEHNLNVARIYAAGGDLRLMEAVIEHFDTMGDSPVLAVVDRRKGRVTERRYNTAVNKGLPMAVVDGFDADWVPRVLSVANIPLGKRKA